MKKIITDTDVQNRVMKSILWASEFSKRLTVVILIIYIINFLLGWLYQFYYHDGSAPMTEYCADLMRIVVECYLVKSGVENVSKGVCSVLNKKWNVENETQDEYEE